MSTPRPGKSHSCLSPTRLLEGGTYSLGKGVKRGERGLAYKFRKGVCRRDGKEKIKDCRTWGTLDTA